MSNGNGSTSSINHPALDGFDGRIKRVWKSPFYVAALGIVALFMVLLPLVYLGMIAAVGYATYYHATVDWTGLMHTGNVGRVAIYKTILIYIMPLIAGAILIVFMIKPLFARPSRRDKRMSLVRSNDPLIFEFVDRVCAAVGSPRPKRIDVDWRVNASASFRREWISLLLPGDLVLTIGASLVAGMTLNQFAGVLAHEFGHFSQGLGMRLSSIIRSVSNWFVRVVYERDNWDNWLIEMSQNDNGWVAAIFMFARMCVWLTRKLLWLLMGTGHVVSCALIRQMEFDADKYEMRLVGSEVFERTCHRLAELGVAGQALHFEMGESWKDGKLPDNYPIVLAAKCDDLPAQFRTELRKHSESGKSGLFSTHPSDKARIRQARKESADGVFDVPGPASQLFGGFEGLCKAVTMMFYRDCISAKITPANLMPTDALIARRTQARRAKQSADRFFCGALSAIRPIRIDPFSKHLTDDSAVNIERIKRARTALANSEPVIGKLYSQYARATDTVSATRAIEELANAKVKISPSALDLKSKSVHQVGEERVLAERSLEQSREQIAKIEAVIQIRLESALGLLSSEQITTRVRGWQRLRARAQTLLETLSVFDRSRSALDRLRNEQLALRAMTNLLADNAELWGDQLLAPAGRIAIKQHEALSDLRTTLSNHRYPFAHGDGQLSLAGYAIGTMPPRSDIFQVTVAVERTLDRTESLYHRVMGELAQIAEATEAAMGLNTQSISPKTSAPTPTTTTAN